MIPFLTWSLRCRNAVPSAQQCECVNGKRTQIMGLFIGRSLDKEQLSQDQIKETVHYLENLDLELGPVQMGLWGVLWEREGRLFCLQWEKYTQIFGQCFTESEGDTDSYTPRFVPHFSSEIMFYLDLWLFLHRLYLWAFFANSGGHVTEFLPWNVSGSDMATQDQGLKTSTICSFTVSLHPGWYTWDFCPSSVT